MSPFSMNLVAEFAELLTTALIHFVWQGAVLMLILLVMAKAQANADLGEAGLNFTKVRAPFDGFVDRVKQQGSLARKGDILATLSDNSLVWDYFNVPEARYPADFPNPNRLRRHGQRGTVLISRVLNDAIVIPQTATFQLLDKRYVCVVDKEDVAHLREIVIQHELEDLFVIEKGVGVDDRSILEEIRRVHDGEKVECEDRAQRRG